MTIFYDIAKQREELRHFEIDGLYYHSLLIIISDSPISQVREMTIKSIKQSTNWKDVFIILSTAAEDPEQSIIEIGYEKLKDFD